MLDIDPSLEHVADDAARAASPGARTGMCSFRLHAEHPYQNIVAIFEIPDARRDEAVRSGLHHMQLRNASIAVLGERYRRLRAAGIAPHRAMDHGPSSSLYYRDPDHHVVEIAACNFLSPEETQACLASVAYTRNPAGRAIDPETLFGDRSPSWAR